MTQLKCSATTCHNNKNHLCILNSIHVDGSTAHESEQTCCGSFTPRLSSMDNSTHGIDVRPETKIKCHARDCVYNKDMLCSADSVQIAGHGADRSGDTECSTFRMR